jgi:hypothetical protein
VDGEGLSGGRLLLLPAIIIPRAAIANDVEAALRRHDWEKNADVNPPLVALPDKQQIGDAKAQGLAKNGGGSVSGKTIEDKGWQMNDVQREIFEGWKPGMRVQRDHNRAP